jgi:hypothetical protein
MTAASRQLVGELRVTAYPRKGPYDRWELTVEATGEVLASGPMPADNEAIRAAASAYCRIGVMTWWPEP